ncbi:MAG: hypothetical protein KIS66_17585 [Fimbriimonadaceae bacterium]|nr:hypothetical protein [Fimbriimonadaceae bacterium]
MRARGRPMRFRPGVGGTVEDYLLDSLGSVVGVLDSSQALTETFAYRPFGELAPGEFEPEWRPFLWVGGLGYFFDGLRYYVRARMYRPDFGSWNQLDPIWPLTAPYSYVGGRPSTFVDPSGLQLIQGWSWSKYWSDCGAVLQGYGDVLNPAAWFDGMKNLAWTAGEQGFGAAGSQLLDGLVRSACFWEAFGETDNCRAFGNRFGSSLLLYGGGALKVNSLGVRTKVVTHWSNKAEVIDTFKRAYAQGGPTKAAEACSGAWVMIGGRTPYNHLMSGRVARYKDSVTVKVPTNCLYYPPGMEYLKAPLGQRIVGPPRPWYQWWKPGKPLVPKDK